MTAFPAIFFAPTHPNQQSACEICGLALPALGAAAVMYALTRSLRKRVIIPLVKVNELVG
jgi:hypothetical protein